MGPEHVHSDGLLGPFLCTCCCPDPTPSPVPEPSWLDGFLAWLAGDEPEREAA